MCRNERLERRASPRMDIEIGKGKTGRRAYGLDEIAIVPSRRTRDPEDIDISWSFGNLHLDLPCVASALDAAVDPKTAGIIGRLGGLAVLNLEGIQTRYEDPEPVFEEIASLPGHKATRLMQELYAEPVKEELIFRRVQEIKDQGVIAAASLTPQRVERYHRSAIEAGLDVLVIQGTVVSAEHVSQTVEPLNLMEFVPSLNVPVVVGGCGSCRGRSRSHLHDARRDRRRRTSGDGRRRRCGRQDASLPRDRRVRQRYRRWWDAHRWRGGQGHSVRRRRRNARERVRQGRGGARTRLLVGDGDLPPDAAAGDAHQDQRYGDSRRDPCRTRP